jgi:hypothetical protein
MLKLDVNLAPFFAIALANFILGWLWYSPLLFMKPWMKALGKDPNKRQMSAKDKERMPMLFAGAIISSLALSFALQVLVHSVGASDFGQGAVLGLLLWMGFALTTSLGTLWEGRSGIVIQVNSGNSLVAYVLFAGILAAWH